jgi:hypothetical protein
MFLGPLKTSMTARIELPAEPHYATTGTWQLSGAGQPAIASIAVSATSRKRRRFNYCALFSQNTCAEPSAVRDES